ncbi:DUF935 domain-containing protein [Ideonella sp.]|uniref:DUF935 domain-containing protein n=1 Tax=Ideonella sp. TaxID=1929293 RepID=UPI003BB722FC
MADTKRPASRDSAEKPVLDTEIATRLKDPFEPVFMGVLRPNDTVLQEKGGGNNWQIYRDLKRDGKVFSGMTKFINTLIRFPYQLDPVEDTPRGRKDAGTLKQLLDGCAFNQACKDLMEAQLMGFSPVELVPTMRDGLVAPGRFVKRAQRRFVFVQDDDQQPPKLRMLTATDMLRGVELPERKFIVHRVNPEDDNPYGTGLGHQLYWPVYFKRKGIVAWSKLVDRFGSPTPWGKFPNGATPQQRGTLRDALQAFSNDGFIMTPDGNAIELLESKLTGSVTTQQALCEYMDDWISEIWLGQQPRGGSGGAQAASANERESVRLDLVQGADELLCDTLNQTLLAWLSDWNGLTPCRISRKIEAPEDKKAASETDKNVASLGYRPTLRYVQERYGEGWELIPTTPLVVAGKAGPQFSELALPPDQLALDAALQRISPLRMAEAAQAMLAPLVDAVESSASFEEALAKLEAAYPTVDTQLLAGMLANAMFDGALHGAVAAERESS